ncbi:UDP-glucuronosyltransferase-like [Ctenocephalides felis]|uniref:UDP-glucuronosyltransferase-like n=1 Tax=Ctenocephalides felis TaxID=7515 RepID=UPI000E6E5ADD|nr:UDP-glucuronosyltransferase-like [Ctenocephalides felis]
MALHPCLFLDISIFFESSKKGAILLSLGTNVKSSTIGPERIQIFIKTMRKFPDYHFLWKFEEDPSSLNLPKNVMVKKWIEQNNILAHPKVILFLTHGGLLSSQEATWHGVPMLGIPVVGDQHSNVKRSIDAGVAESVNIYSLNEDELTSKLKKMLEDTSYRHKMSQRSSRFRDRPLHPLKEALWWCEYMLRHKGAPHLRSQARALRDPTLFMWDLLIVWMVGFVGVIFGFNYLVKRVFKTKEIEQYWLPKVERIKYN